MTEWLGRPARNVPREPIPPLKISISKKLKAYVQEKYTNAGVQKNKYIVIHGIESDSVASMQSRGDKDSLLPIEVWAEIAKDIRYTLSETYDTISSYARNCIDKQTNVCLICESGVSSLCL